MDPLTAAGLAGNIITFIDFSTKLLSRTKQLFDSTTGATAENGELETLTANLKALADRVQQRPPQIPRKSHLRLNITSETVLDNLSQQCVQVANELLETLESIKVQVDGRSWKIAGKAVKTFWKQDRIDALQGRLDRVSKQLMDGLGMEQLEEINSRLREMAVENTRLEANRSQEIEQLRKDFSSAIGEIKANVTEEMLPGAWLVLSDTAHRGQGYFAEQVILQSLAFSSIDSRHEAISREHSRTFSWAFDETSSTKLVDWLKKEDGIYWVTGKPGSGKSTLMKFMAGHEQTKTHLEEWAGAKKLVIANFYFWNASMNGSQRSQRGLLRTILYQILRQCPELIQEAYHDQWIAMTSDGKVLKEARDELLTVPSLLDTLRKISTSTASDTKFCFFLDGLDEYDGRSADIIQLVDILKSFPNVKTCVSSRPWNEFEDHFGNKSPWKLCIHDFTRDDIRLFVEDTLGKSTRFQVLRKEDPQCSKFVQDIVRDADGVFLWVFLVTQSLLDGLTNSDRIKDLQQRLKETPKDLKDYFKTILFSTENRYRTQTARMLTVAVNSATELPLMAYWVIDQEDLDYIFQCPVETPAKEILEARLDNTRRRLKVLSKGLLEASEVVPDSTDGLLFGYPVGFLHRTVKDYLYSPEAKTMLQSWLDSAFNTDWELCCAFGVLLKMASLDAFLPSETEIRSNTFELLAHVLRIDQNAAYRELLASLLEHLQTSLLPAFEEHQAILYEGFTKKRTEMRIFKGDKLEPDVLVLSACSCVGVMNFVADKLEREPQLCNRVTGQVATLFINAIFTAVPMTEGLEFNSLHPGLSMLKLLLDLGVDPNSGATGKSEWCLILTFLSAEMEAIEDDVQTVKFEWFNVVKLLLRYGANLEQRFDTGPGDATARDKLKDWFGADQFAVLEDIVKRREKGPKKSKKLTKKIRHLKLWVNSKK